MTAGPSTCINACWCRRAASPIWYGRKQDANGAKRTAYLEHDNIIGYPDHYVQSTERHPMDLLSQIIAERGWDRPHDRRRDGQLLFFGGRFRFAAKASAECPLQGRGGARQLAARGQEPDRARLHAQGRQASSN
jgi:hypothetical protein